MRNDFALLEQQSFNYLKKHLCSFAQRFYKYLKQLRACHATLFCFLSVTNQRDAGNLCSPEFQAPAARAPAMPPKSQRSGNHPAALQILTRCRPLNITPGGTPVTPHKKKLPQHLATQMTPWLQKTVNNVIRETTGNHGRPQGDHGKPR